MLASLSNSPRPLTWRWRDVMTIVTGFRGKRLHHAGAVSIFYYTEHVVVTADIDHAFSRCPRECLHNTITALHQTAIDIWGVWG